MTGDFVTMRDATGASIVYRRTLVEVARFADRAEAQAFVDWRNGQAAPPEIEDAAAAAPQRARISEPVASFALPGAAPEPAAAFVQSAPVAVSPPADPYAPEGEAFARLERGAKLTVVADELGLDWKRLHSAWANAEQARKREEAAADTQPVMDAAPGAKPRAEPRPAVVPTRAAPPEGWAYCARCNTLFNAEKSKVVNRLRETPTECGGCRK